MRFGSSRTGWEHQNNNAETKGMAMAYYLGVDVGSSKTHVLITDEHGIILAFARGGAGNHEVVGYDGLAKVLCSTCKKAFEEAGLQPVQISGAGFGVSGYDWPAEAGAHMEIIHSLGLSCPLELINDVELGLMGGTPHGWGVAVVSGTGCNCRGWDAARQKRGRVTGGGLMFGEAAGGSDLLVMAIHAISHEWSKRGPSTAITHLFVEHYGVKDAFELLQGVSTGALAPEPGAAPLVFQAAAGGDAVAQNLIRWAGRELGEMANAVIRQCEFEEEAFDLVLIGSLFNGSPEVTEEMKRTVHALAPGARFLRLEEPPVLGAVLLAMKAAGVEPAGEVRSALACNLKHLR